MSSIGWGVVGTGGIASRFVEGLAMLPDATALAVGSRRQETADEFARRHSVERAYPSYDALIADPDVDVVYVATPHPAHHHVALLAIEAGKAVLVEKAFTMDAQEASELVAAARARGTFLMEAMWTRFLPHVVGIRELLASGVLGQVTTVTADHGQWFPADPRHRLFAPELGGGALLDLGIYPVSFVSMVLGTPSKVTAVSERAFTGVDATTSALLQHDGGGMGVVTTSLLAAGPNRASVEGTEARIEIDRTWYAPTSFTVIAHDGTVLERYDEPHEGTGLRHEAAEVGRCLREGLPESPAMPLDETVSIMATMDEIRRQIGLTYPPST